METAPPIPALAPNASFEILYLVFPAEDCENHRVRMSVPLADDTTLEDNTLEAQLCDKDQGADLKLESLGIDPADFRYAKFKVTNVGKVRTEATTRHVETNSPLPAQEAPAPIPALDPGASYEFRYQFSAGGCDNHHVTASVPLAGDRYPINNTRQVQVCGPRPATPVPVPDPIVVGPAPRSTLPEHLRPGGPYTVARGLTAVRLVWQAYSFSGDDVFPGPYCEDRNRDPGFLAVGYDHEEHDCASGAIYQTAFRFDFDDLRAHIENGGALFIEHARLSWAEVPRFQRSNGGGPMSLFSCVGAVGLPAVDWGGWKGLIPHDVVHEGEVAVVDARRVLDVTDAARGMLSFPAQNHGFLLRGLNESRVYDNGACVSAVSDFKLEVRHHVLK